MWCCSDVKFVFHWYLFKPVEPVLNGKPVLSGQLAIPQGSPFSTGLTVFRFGLTPGGALPYIGYIGMSRCEG